MILNKNGAKYRELLWRACCINGDPAQQPFVICNLCHLPVDPGSDWNESHIGVPAALGGMTVGIAHRRCNLDDAAGNVIPFVAKTRRMHRNHVGIARPGLSRQPLPFGRNSGAKKKLSGEIVKRISGSEKHRRLMAERYGEEA